MSRRAPWSWLLALALTVFAVAPLTYPGFFEARSGFRPVFNLEHLSQAPNWGLPAGRFDPVRGEGRLPYLLAWPFFQATGSGVAGVKWGHGLALGLAALGTYAWTRRWFGIEGAVLAAAVYTYLPWHLSAVYVRGAYAEAWLWAVGPLALWAVDSLADRRLLPALLVGLPAWTAALWIQRGLAVFLLLLVAAYGLVRLTMRWRWVGLPLALSVAWLVARTAPAAGQSPELEFLYPFQLFSAAWNLGQGASGGAGISFQLGLAAVGLSIVATALLAREWATVQRPLATILVFWLGALLLVTLACLRVSSFLWRLSGFDSLVTAPWQLLILAGLPLAFLAGSVVRLEDRLAALPSWAGLVALVVLASYPYLTTRFTQVDPGPEPVAMFQPGAAGESAPQIMILAYEVMSPTEITPTLTLTLTWQAVAPVAGDYTVFVHALNSDGSKAAQRDTRPCNGECPTSAWIPGEIVIDRYELDLGQGAAADPYRLAVGLYLLETGERAAVWGREDGTVFLDVP